MYFCRVVKGSPTKTCALVDFSLWLRSASDSLDVMGRHDIIGLDLDSLQVVTKLYHFDIEDGLDAIASL